MVRIAAIADIHAHLESVGHLAPLFAQANREADVFILAGDLTLTGEVREAEVLVGELSALRIPIVGVLGNHDCELDNDPTIAQLLREHGVHMLEAEPFVLEVNGCTVGFAGTKGFCGGFQKYAVEPFGERALKDFVNAGRRESFILEQQLSSLRTDFRVVVLHYAPIRETLLGEPLELYPFLGNSALARPIDKFGADVVIHGHAHYGSPFGRTSTGVPVYNVARPVVHTYAIHTLVKPQEREPSPEGVVRKKG
jgi:Icc-related predicted phosphoesterase